MTDTVLKPFDTLILQGPFSVNGYVVIPDDWPIDYTHEKYREIDASPIGELTFGGYAYLENGEYKLIAEIFLSNPDSSSAKRFVENEENCVPILGFDDNHAWPIDKPGQEGADHLVNELKKLQ